MSSCFGRRLSCAPEFFEGATSVAETDVAVGGEFEDAFSASAFAGFGFVLFRFRQATLFEAAKGDEDRGRRHRFPGGGLELFDHRRTVGATAQALEGQHDVVFEFTERESTHHSPSIKVTMLVW